MTAKIPLVASHCQCQLVFKWLIQIKTSRVVMPLTDSLAASIPQRWNSTMCMMVYGAKWWRERGRTSGANFLEETRLDWCSHASTRQGCRAQQMFIDATLHFFFLKQGFTPISITQKFDRYYFTCYVSVLEREVNQIPCITYWYWPQPSASCKAMKSEMRICAVN